MQSKKHQKNIYRWLMTGCFLIVLMVVVGGITRLTESGLSMTNWKPVTGFLPPLSPEAWQKEFNDYQNSPEFKHYNHHFSIEDYKTIYFWEYVHRLLGRVIGFVFIIPLIYFWIRKAFSYKLKKRLLIIFFLGLSQGVMGWLMVKSGLVDQPHVSQYRLLLHLFFAILLALYIYYTALLVKNNNRPYKPQIKQSLWTHAVLFLTLIQVAYGALVAGLKAGFVYNTYPKMGSTWIPQSFWNTIPDLGGLVIFEDAGTVQFIHRSFALVLVFVTLLFWNKFKSFELPRWIALSVILQTLMGVLTLIYVVPIFMGVLHQLIAILILILLTHQLFICNYPKSKQIIHYKVKTE